MQQTAKMSLKGKTFRKCANGQNIYDSENEIDPRGSSVNADESIHSRKNNPSLLQLRNTWSNR